MKHRRPDDLYSQIARLKTIVEGLVRASTAGDHSHDDTFSSTVGFGLPTLTGRAEGHQHYNLDDGKWYVVTGVAGGQPDVDVTMVVDQAVSFMDVSFLLRATDADDFLAVQLWGGSGGRVQIFKAVAGADTAIATWLNPMTTPTTHTLRIVAHGDRFRVWHNGVERIDYTLSGAESALFATPTGMGYRISSDVNSTIDSVVITGDIEATDTFTRANAPTLGATETGEPYTVYTGAIAIVSNKAKATATGSGVVLFNEGNDVQSWVSTDEYVATHTHGSSGHTIEDSAGTDMTSRTNLMFGTGLTVTDDAANNRTRVDATGGGGGAGSAGTTPIVCRVHKTANQSCTNGANTVLTFEAESRDTNGLHSTVTNTSRITVTETGDYEIECQVAWAGNTTGNRLVSIRKNGAATILALTRQRALSTLDSKYQQCGTAIVPLVAGDYVEVHVEQDSGGALNVLLGEAFTWFSLKSANPQAGPAAGAKVTKSAVQAVATATPTAITWDGEDYDTSLFHDTTTNTERITIPAGTPTRYYLVGHSTRIENLAAGVHAYGAIRKNGGTVIPGTRQQVTAGGAGSYVVLTAAAVVSLAAGDYVDVVAYHEAGANRDVGTTANGSSFWLQALPGESAPEVWHAIGGTGEPAFTNSWVNFGGTEQTAAFYKDRERVYLRGLIKSGTLNSVAFTLPVGYRPTATETFPIKVGGNAIGVCIITAAGAVSIYVLGGTNAEATLSGISFRIS